MQRCLQRTRPQSNLWQSTANDEQLRPKRPNQSKGPKIKTISGIVMCTNRAKQRERGHTHTSPNVRS